LILGGLRLDAGRYRDISALLLGQAEDPHHAVVTVQFVRKSAGLLQLPGPSLRYAVTAPVLWKPLQQPRAGCCCTPVIGAAQVPGFTGASGHRSENAARRRRCVMWGESSGSIAPQHCLPLREPTTPSVSRMNAFARVRNLSHKRRDFRVGEVHEAPRVPLTVTVLMKRASCIPARSIWS
jgi:hypothetical protein